MRKEISAFHYLTQDLPHRSHAEQVLMACEAGVKWIQLRVKNKPFDEWLKITKEARVIARRFNATLIINDSVEIAALSDSDGVHLGQEDFSPVEARKILGEGKIIGFSTHSLDEILAARDYDIDYFGLGPFRFTSTKEKLNPVLGIEGIHRIVQQARSYGVLKPVIAIGGIHLHDVNELMQTGIEGIAVSSAINLAEDPLKMSKLFIEKLQTPNSKLQTLS